MKNNTDNIQVGFSMHPRWSDGVGLEGFLSPLRAAGLTVLEYELDKNLDMWESFPRQMMEAQNLGMQLSFHAPYRVPYNLVGFSGGQREKIEKLYREMLDIASALAARDGVIKTVVIHAATAPKPARVDDLVADTVSFLRWACDAYSNLLLALENNHPASGNQVKVGVARDGVLGIVSAVRHPRLRVCWDMGHDYLSGSPVLPEPEWLAEVAHVHVHDVNDSGVDHYPLVYGNVPYQPWLRALKQTGMKGSVVLELKGNQLKDWPPDQIQSALIDSVRAIFKEVQ